MNASVSIRSSSPGNQATTPSTWCIWARLAGKIGTVCVTLTTGISSSSPITRAISGNFMRPRHCALGSSFSSRLSIVFSSASYSALDELAIICEPVNRVLEVDLDGDDVLLTFTICLLPSHNSRFGPHFPNPYAGLYLAALLEGLLLLGNWRRHNLSKFHRTEWCDLPQNYRAGLIDRATLAKIQFSAH